MTDTEAINILDAATQPQSVGKITRQGYAQIEQALQHIAERLKPKDDNAAGPGQ